MKNRSKLTRLLLLNLIVLAISCTSNQKTEDSDKKNRWSNFDINSLSYIEPMNIIDTSSIKIIRLETNKESAFAEIDRLIVTDEFIIVCDFDITKAVMMFDREGNFIRRISREGRGPGEYTRLYAVDIDQKNQQIIIYDLSMRKLIFYRYNGTFLKEIYLKNYYGMTFTCINDTLFAFYLQTNMDGKYNKFDWGDGCELLFVNKEGEIVNTAFKLKFKDELSGLWNMSYFAKNDSKTYFIPSYHGKIYQIVDNGNIVEEFDFQLDDLLFNSKDINNIDTPRDFITFKKFDAFSDFIINSRGQFFCESSFNGIPVKFFGDSKSKNVIAFDSFTEKGKMNQFNLNRYMLGTIVATHNDYFVSSIATHSLKKSYFPDADRSDNNSIAFFKFKDDLNLDELIK